MDLPILVPWTVKRGVTRPHEKEAPEAMVFRLLGVPSCDEVEILDIQEGAVRFLAGGRERVTSLSSARMWALTGWLLTRMHTLREDRTYVELLVVLGPGGDLLCQRKDMDYPEESFRGKLSLFGGGVHEGESRPGACVRELYEEIRDLATADEIANALEEGPLLTFPYQGVRYQAGGTIARAPDADTFERWRRVLSDPANLGEAQPAFVPGFDLVPMIAEQCLQPLKHFAGVHHLVIAAVLALP